MRRYENPGRARVCQLVRMATSLVAALLVPSAAWAATAADPIPGDVFHTQDGSLALTLAITLVIAAVSLFAIWKIVKARGAAPLPPGDGENAADDGADAQAASDGTGDDAPGTGADAATTNEATTTDGAASSPSPGDTAL